jgi:hypothetical protein
MSSRSPTSSHQPHLTEEVHRIGIDLTFAIACGLTVPIAPTEGSCSYADRLNRREHEPGAAPAGFGVGHASPHDIDTTWTLPAAPIPSELL